MTTPTGPDRGAPVLAYHEIDIAAPLATVWALHAGVSRWTAWHPEVTAARLDGPFAPGSSLTWTSSAFTVTSAIYSVEGRSRTLWGGTSQGITGVHEWRFEPAARGVRVSTTESFAGDPVDADSAGMQTVLRDSLATWLTRLKQEAELSASNR